MADFIKAPVILLKEFVGSFPSLFKPMDAMGDDGKPKYKVTAI
jgi:hypothetical protein